MNLNDALALIASFSKKSTDVFSAGDNSLVDGKPVSSSFIEGSRTGLPLELIKYIDSICPAEGLSLEGVGHPVELLKCSDLAWQPPMYSQLTGELAKWQDDWFLIAHEGGDPIIVKTSEQGENSPVYSAIQGMGVWNFAPIADSIGQFLVCICAIQHALNFPGLSQPLDEDFNLAPAAANWLFPLLRQHAGAHYDEWASVFENYL
ncbi:MAG: hypothetical protein V7765_02635 [Oleispira sp.]